MANRNLDKGLEEDRSHAEQNRSVCHHHHLFFILIRLMMYTMNQMMAMAHPPIKTAIITPYVVIDEDNCFA